MAEDLLQAGAGLLEGASRAASDLTGQADERRRTADATLQAGTKQLSGAITDKRALDQQKELAGKAQAGENQRAQMQTDANMVTITPEIAKGLALHSGNQDYEKMAGQKVPFPFILGLFAHDAKKNFAPKVVAVQNGNEVSHVLAYIGDDGQPVKIPLDEGGAKWNPKAGRGGAGGGSGAKLDPKDKEFLKTYRQYAKDTEGINYKVLETMGKSDKKSAGELKGKLDFVGKNKTRFDKLQGMDDGTAAGGEGDGGGSPDEVIMIQDSEGQTHQIYRKNLKAAQDRDKGVKEING